MLHYLHSVLKKGFFFHFIVINLKIAFIDYMTPLLCKSSNLACSSPRLTGLTI